MLSKPWASASKVLKTVAFLVFPVGGSGPRGGSVFSPAFDAPIFMSIYFVLLSF